MPFFTSSLQIPTWYFLTFLTLSFAGVPQQWATWSLMLQVPPQSGTSRIQPMGQKWRRGKTGAVILARFSLPSRLLSPHFLSLDSQAYFSLTRKDLKINIGWALTRVWLATKAFSTDFPKQRCALRRTPWQKCIPQAKPSVPSQGGGAPGINNCRALDWPST